MMKTNSRRWRIVVTPIDDQMSEEHSPNGTSIPALSDAVVRELWERAFLEHLMPSRLFRLAVGLALPESTESDHLASCTRCQDVITQYQTGSDAGGHGRPVAPRLHGADFPPNGIKLPDNTGIDSVSPSIREQVEGSANRESDLVNRRGFIKGVVESVVATAACVSAIAAPLVAPGNARAEALRGKAAISTRKSAIRKPSTKFCLTYTTSDSLLSKTCNTLWPNCRRAASAQWMLLHKRSSNARDSCAIAADGQRRSLFST